MGIASAIWYGGITLLGALIGAHWERIVGILEGVNRTLGIVTVRRSSCVARPGIWASRRSRARERVWHATRDALDPAAPSFLAGHRHRRGLRPGGRGAAGARAGLRRSRAHPGGPRAGRRSSARTLGTRCRPIAIRSPRRRRSGAPGSREYAGRLRQRFGQRAAPRAGRADVDRRVQRRRHRRPRGPADALAAELLGVGPGRGRGGPPAAPRRSRRNERRRRLGTRSTAASGWRGSATSSRSRPATARIPSRRTCATSGAWASSRSSRGVRDPARVDRPLLRDFVYLLKDLGLSAATIRREVSAIRTYYGFLVGEGRVGRRSERPAGDAAPGPRRFPDTLSVREVEALLAAPAIDDPLGWRDRALLELGYGAGTPRVRALRPGAHRPAAAREPRARLRQRAARSGWSRSAGASSARSRCTSTRCVRRSIAGQQRGAGPAQRAGRAALAGRGMGHRQARRRSAPASASGSPRTRCGTASPPTCSKAAPTCARCRRCSATRTSPPPRSTPTWTASTSARFTSSFTRAAETTLFRPWRSASAGSTPMGPRRRGDASMTRRGCSWLTARSRLAASAQDTVRFTPTVAQPTFAVREPVLRVRPGHRPGQPDPLRALLHRGRRRLSRGSRPDLRRGRDHQRHAQGRDREGAPEPCPRRVAGLLGLRRPGDRRRVRLLNDPIPPGATSGGSTRRGWSASPRCRRAG